MRLILALLTALLPLSAAAKVPHVVTDIPPVAALVAQVMGDLGAPAMLLDKGGDEHDMQLRPSQLRDLSAADLVVWVGPDLTPGLATALASTGAPALALLDDPATARMDYAGGGVNPHAWLDPQVAAAWTGLIAARLSAMDPDHAATYAANAAAADRRLAALRDELAQQLAPVASRPWLGWHDAYAYFARAFPLAYLGGLSEGDEAPPGAARLAEVKALAAAGGIACAFPEAQHDPGLIAALGPVALGAPLDPVGSMQDAGPDAYDATLRAIADSLRACLSP